MSTAEHLLARLAKLQPQDRAWVVSQLSARQRGALMDLAQVEPSARVDRPSVARVHEPVVAQRAVDDAAAPADVFKSATASEVVAALGSEPVWLIRAVLTLDEWPWAEQFLEQLSPAIRTSVLQVSARTVAPVVRDMLIRQCVQRLRGATPEELAQRKPTLMERVRHMLIARRLALRS
jgi:hypothetical protein